MKFASPALVTETDLSCHSRREGGAVEQRALVRAFEKLLRYSPLGLPIMAGIVPESLVIKAAGLSAIW